MMTLHTPKGDRAVMLYRVLSDPMEWEIRAETSDADNTIILGDRGQRPAPLEVEVSVQEATLAESMALANAILRDAEAATSITLPLGTRSVLRVLRSNLSASGPLVTLRISFAPGGP